MTEEYWIKENGNKIAVGDMDIEHLRNALRMIIRKHRRLRKNIGDEMQWEKDFWQEESPY